MGYVEEQFAAGGAAYRAGEPRDTVQPFDWKCGWDSAQTSKMMVFRDYIKYRELHAQGYAPPGFTAGMKASAQAGRQRRIEQWEAEFPDFSAAYDKWKASR